MKKKNVVKKEINEKTFELNITNELLNISKSFLWYMDYSPIKNQISSNVWPEFFNQPCLYAMGLTQQEESNTETGGYDVSINYSLPNGDEARIMFLQYKAGSHITYSKLKGSKFEKSKVKDTKHACFTFNDAAKGTQHSTLTKLAKSLDKTSNSVLYVFPRITKKEDFLKKVGQLIYSTSFVPALEIDKQAAENIPPLIITNDSHKFRVSYDGSISEVNLLLLLLNLDQGIVFNILTELICIQVERFFKILKRANIPNLTSWIDIVSNSVNGFVLIKLNGFNPTTFNTYINNVRTRLEKDNFIPQAPSRFTSIIPTEGLKLNFEDRLDFSPINYQIF